MYSWAAVNVVFNSSFQCLGFIGLSLLAVELSICT